MQTQELLDRYEYAVKQQMQEIDRLRAELGRRDEELTQLLAWIKRPQFEYGCRRPRRNARLRPSAPMSLRSTGADVTKVDGRRCQSLF
jgi:hypothetical protein